MRLLIYRTLLLCSFLQLPAVAIADDVRAILIGAGVRAPDAPEPICVNEPEQSMESYTERQLGGKTAYERVFGNEEKCLRDHKINPSEIITSDDANAYIKGCAFRQNFFKKLSGNFRDVQITSFFQDLASRSQTQIICRSRTFSEYFTKSESKKSLNTRANEKFEIVKDRVAGLIIAKKRALQVAQNTELDSNTACSNPGPGYDALCAVQVQGAVAEENQKYEAAVVAELVKVPYGYEPEVASALVAMANSGEFSEQAYEQALFKTDLSYRNLNKFYTDRSTSANGYTSYCIDRDFKEYAVTNGITDKLIDSYSDDVMNKKSKIILQCKINSKYKVAPENINTTMNFAFLVGGGVTAVLTALPTGGGSLGAYAAIAGIGISAGSFANQVSVAHKACTQNTYLLSSEGKEQCNPEQDFEKAMSDYSMSSCLTQSGLAAIVAIPIPLDIAIAVKARRAAGLARVESAAVQVETRVSTSTISEVDNPVTEIVVTGKRNVRIPTRSAKVVDASAASTGPITPSSIESAGWSNFLKYRKWEVTPVSHAVNPKWDSLPAAARQTLADARQYNRENILMAVTEKNFNLKNDYSHFMGRFQRVSKILPQNMRASHARAMEMMADTGRWANYYEDLMGEVFTRMVNSKISRYREMVEQGKIDPQFLEEVLEARMARRGLRVVEIPADQGVVTTTKFRQYLRQGVPLDRALEGQIKSHGAYPHLLQMDYIMDDMLSASQGQIKSTQEFFDYWGGSQTGLTVWNDMFDHLARARDSLRNTSRITNGPLRESITPPKLPNPTHIRTREDVQ